MSRAEEPKLVFAFDAEDAWLLVYCDATEPFGPLPTGKPTDGGM